MKIETAVLAQIRDEYLALHSNAPRAASKYLREAAEKHQVNMKTLHRQLDLKVRKPRETSLTTTARQEYYNSYAAMVWKYSLENSYGDHNISIAIAFDCLQAQERIPADVSVKQIYAAMDRLTLRNESMPLAKTMTFKRPMDHWQLDFSKSAYVRHLSEGEVRIEKPEFTKRQPDGKSLWIGVAVDHCSRVIYLEYFQAKGESADEVIDFTLHAFEAKPYMMQLQGIPKNIFVDRGSGWMDGRTQQGLLKLGVNQILGANDKDSMGRELKRSNKKARGAIERTVRTVKEWFEAKLFLMHGHNRVLTIAQLNTFAAEWTEEFNQAAHPIRREEGKWNIFWADHEEFRYPADDARAFFSRAIMRRVVARKIRVAADVYCIAPNFLNDGDEVEIIRDPSGYYVFHNSKRFALRENTNIEETAAPIETRQTAYAERQLSKRFDEELQKRLGLTLRRLSEDLFEDMKQFFEAPKTVAEIEEQVDWLRLRLEIRQPTNVIQLPQQNHVR